MPTNTFNMFLLLSNVIPELINALLSLLTKPTNLFHLSWINGDKEMLYLCICC